jgi:cyclase
MLKKRLILVLTFNDGVLFRTKNFIADYRYTKNFIDLWAADEIILLDISKKNKLSQKFLDIVKFFSLNCFLPLSVGGGIRSFKDAVNLFKQGADKIVLNSSTYKNPDLIRKISKVFGSQSIIHSIDCRKIKKNKYEVIINNILKTNLDPIQWAKIAIQNGCGELLINSIDNDGSLLGYDLELNNFIVKKVNVPCLALGGAGNWDHILQLFKKTNISAACTQNIYHFTNESLISAKKYLKKNKVLVRQ